VTTAVAYADLGPWNTVIALSIAGLKGALVACFFMHLSDSPSLQRLFALGALFWLLLLVALVLVDVNTRASVAGW
jgi:cytochrome c oxidase subunit 4